MLRFARIATAGTLAGLLASSPAHAECEEPVSQLDSAQRAVLSADLDGARQHIDRALAALGCMEGVADPSLLARIWLVEGALATFEGDEAGAALAWAAAHRVSPALWIEDYGMRLRRAYDAASAFEPGTGVVTLDPPLGAAEGFIDGPWAVFPADTQAGLHAIQVVSPEGETVFGGVVFVGEGSNNRVTTGLSGPYDALDIENTEPTEAENLPATLHSTQFVEVDRPKKSPTAVRLIVSGSVLAAAGAAAGTTSWYLATQADAGTDKQAQMYRALNYSGWSMTLVGTALVGAGIVVHTRHVSVGFAPRPGGLSVQGTF